MIAESFCARCQLARDRFGPSTNELRDMALPIAYLPSMTTGRLVDRDFPQVRYRLLRRRCALDVAARLSRRRLFHSGADLRQDGALAGRRDPIGDFSFGSNSGRSKEVVS